MQRRKPFGKLRAKQGEGGHATSRRQVAGAGIVADEDAGLIHQRKQFRDAARAEDVFSPVLPPGKLAGITGNLHGDIFLAQPGGNFLEIFQRPHPHRQPGAAVKQRHAGRLARWRNDSPGRRQVQPEGLAGNAPGFVAVRQRIGPGKLLREQPPALEPVEAQPRAGAGQPQ